MLVLPVVVLLLVLVVLFVGYRTKKLRFAAPAAALAAVLLVGLWWQAIGTSVSWDNLTVKDANTVQVAYDSSECESQRSVDVDESDEAVTISITTREFAMSCSDVAVRRTVTVHLDDELGSRTVRDGH